MIETRPIRVWGPPRPEVVAHFRAGPECARGGCHRTGTSRLLGWLLCDPCASAIAVRLFR